MKVFTALSLGVLSTVFCTGQNLGINAPAPSEKLEVGGIIFTNTGGVKFPDSTLQTTAAYNTDPETSVDDRSFIVMEVDGYPAVIDTAGLQGTRVIGFSHHSFSSGGGSVQLDPIQVTKAIDKTTPLAFGDVVAGQIISSIDLHFLRFTPTGLEEYFTITLQNCKLLDQRTRLAYLGDQQWAHVEDLEIDFQIITYLDIDSGILYMHDALSP